MATNDIITIVCHHHNAWFPISSWRCKLDKGGVLAGRQSAVIYWRPDVVVKSFSTAGSIEWCETGAKSVCTPSPWLSVCVTQLLMEAWHTSHMFYCCVQVLCWNFSRVRKVHISLYQQRRCLKETNETKVLVIFSICFALHSENWNILCVCQVSKRENPSNCFLFLNERG